MASRQNASALEVYANKTKFVSAKFADYGDPFYSTITAAIAAAAASDLIIVYPGSYSERIASNVQGLNIFFFPQAVVTDPAGSDGSLISCSGSGTLNIYGLGRFICTEGAYTIYAINTTVGPIIVECDEIGGVCSGIKINTNGLLLKANVINCDIDHQGASGISTVDVNFIEDNSTIKCTNSSAVLKVRTVRLEKVSVSAGSCEIIFSYTVLGTSANEIAVSGGYLELVEGYIPLNSSNNVINLSDAGGKLRLKHVRIVNAGSGPCVNNAGTLITDNCTFVTAGTNSVTGTAPKNWGSVANKVAQNPPTVVEDFSVNVNVE